MAHLSGAMKVCARRSPRIATCTGRRPRRCFGVSPEASPPITVATAKVINFGLIYGMSPFGLARNLGIERGAAQQYVERYFQRYPGVKRFMDETRAQARQIGYVETVFGRRLYLPDIARATRSCASTPSAARQRAVQGTAADIIPSRHDHPRCLVQPRGRPGATHHAGARRAGAAKCARTRLSR